MDVCVTQPLKTQRTTRHNTLGSFFGLSFQLWIRVDF
jgi:hypothetical protein